MLNLATQPRRSIIVVEDERIVAMDLQATLNSLGYDAFAVAASGDEAIARASERCPDVVLMDIRIQGQSDGIQTAEILKRDFGVPIIFLTAYADEATLDRAKRAEPHGYLLKPANPAELQSTIEICLYKHDMERRLRERERWFSTTLESIADAVVTVDLGGRVTFMNAAAEALTGTPAVDATGRSVHEILRLSRSEALPHGKTSREASLLNLATGDERWIHEGAAPVVSDGEKLGAVMVFRDVTEQRKQQKQLELADRLASLGTMAAGVAHEVNNPLAVVIANAEYVVNELEQQHEDLATADLPAAARERHAEIIRAAEDLQEAAARIRSVVAELRTFARPPAHTAGSLDVTYCIGWALRTTSHEFVGRAQLVSHLGEVPHVRGDELRLGQVLVQLLANAAQAIAPGQSSTNTVTITTRSDDASWVVIEIADTGRGIAPEVLPRIFDPFFTTKAHGTGSGLGLSICHGIVTSLGGEIHVESQLSRGSRFRLRLPAAAEHGATAGPATAPRATPARRARVLVVDDEDMVLRVIGRILREHEVTCTHSPMEALALLERGSRFDLIFTDLTMPDMSGVQFYETLLDRDPSLARRVVFLSGGARTSRVDDFLQTVGNPKIDKPFVGETLLGLVQQVLSKGATLQKLK